MLPRVTILRHAEKQIGDAPPLGVTTDGRSDPESLTVRGWQRASALIGPFVPISGNPVPTPTHLFASRVGDDSTDSRRPMETLEPLSQLLGLDIDGRYAKTQIDELVAAIQAIEGHAVVAWEHKRIPPLARLLVGDGDEVPQVWPDDRFDVLWIFEPDEADSRYRFRQVPQMLLPGDREHAI